MKPTLTFRLGRSCSRTKSTSIVQCSAIDILVSGVRLGKLFPVCLLAYIERVQDFSITTDARNYEMNLLICCRCASVHL
jgi:hypothetical protein